MNPEQIDPEIWSDNVVWHFINPNLPDLEGDYQGVEGVKEFFTKLMGLSKGTFKVNPVSISPAGDELVVVHTVNTLTLESQSIKTNVVVVWRIVEGKIAEVWDIPSIKSGVVVQNLESDK